jgi:hypothetical protein
MVVLRTAGMEPDGRHDGEQPAADHQRTRRDQRRAPFLLRRLPSWLLDVRPHVRTPPVSRAATTGPCDTARGCRGATPESVRGAGLVGILYPA